jgi:hypothetical protein
MNDILLADFLAGFGDDTVTAALFTTLPPTQTPCDVIIASVNAYKVAQDAYNIANPTTPINFVGDAVTGNITQQDDGKIIESYSQSLVYDKVYGFASYQPPA